MFLFIATLLLFGCGGNTVKEEPIVLIAHAGGEIDGYVYTNSREALEKSVAAGHSFIELDLLFTADSVLVAAHSWEEFNEATGYAHKGDTAPAFADFSTRRIHGRYTPLSAAEINEFFTADSTLVLVTDKISSPSVLAANFPTLKNRMVVEAFNYNDYSTLLSQGYYRVLYSCLATDLNSALVKHLLLSPLFKGPKIEWITMYVGELDNPLFRFIDTFATFRMALFTVNSIDEIPQDELRNINKVKMIYTDKLEP